MNRLLIAFGFYLSLTVWAQQALDVVPAVEVASSTSDEQRNAERQRLTIARQNLENQYKQDLKACYQKFDVNGCRLEVRERRIQAHTALRKEELQFNASERLIKAQEAQRAVAERNSEAEQMRAQAERDAAVAAAKDRADANAQKRKDHALQGTKREAYEQKQREAAQHREDVAKRLRERNKEPAASLPVPAR